MRTPDTSAVNASALGAALTTLALCLTFATVSAQPNDDCENATPIVIADGGNGLGTFSSAPATLSSATTQTGEYFANSPFLTARSIWYRFTLPEPRRTILQLTTAGIGSVSDVGWTCYRVNSPDDCLPGFDEATSAFFTPTIGTSSSIVACLPPGEFLVQVSANANVGPGTVSMNITTQLCLGTGVEVTDQARTSLFPLPCTSGQTLTMKGHKPSDLLQLLDATGRELVLNASPVPGGSTISTEGLLPGNYSLISKDGRAVRFLIVP